MNQRIQLYYKNVFTEAVGDEHGISLNDLNELKGPIADLTEKMEQARKRGTVSGAGDPDRRIDFEDIPYRDLPYRNEMMENVRNLAGRLAGKYENLVVLGIGGSALGNIALQTALNSPMYNLQSDRGGPRLFVMDNVDPTQFSEIIEYLKPQLDKTLFNVISKSGQTAETAAQFMTILQLLREKGLNLTDHIIATTDTKSGTMRGIVDRLGLTSLEVPEGVGGRFSVLSDVGLFSAAMCGIKIDELLAGARDMDERVRNPDVMKNPAALYAAVQYLFYRRDKRLSVMMPYGYQLKDLCDWFRQLWAESLGKEKNLAGELVNVGPTPIKALGATDQHSQVQLYREGPNDKVFTFLQVESFQSEVVIGDAGETEELSYLSHRKMGDLINNEKLATEYALLASQRPCLTVLFPEINARSVGEFIYMFEVATSYMGGLLGIDTYNQPAVELGKLATFALMGHKDHSKMAEEIEPMRKPDEKFLI
ncbi:MAG: glucose-6-phosphate isomerase [Sedimentisphaerales bacterium]|nr:glucose-6-phosphate isomerase [Sedimentisphaerales bacterium]